MADGDGLDHDVGRRDLLSPTELDDPRIAEVVDEVAGAFGDDQQRRGQRGTAASGRSRLSMWAWVTSTASSFGTSGGARAGATRRFGPIVTGPSATPMRS